MAKPFLLTVLKLLMALLLAGWISLWILKPTEFWTRKWKKAEEKATSSSFGYNGLDFVAYTFPVIALAIIGFIYLELKQRESTNRQGRSAITSLSSPLVVNKYVGILSGVQILVSSLFMIFLIWTFYARISNDFQKMRPVKSFKLNLWQYKLFRISTRCGSLAEACLALLLVPVLRGMSIFRIIGIQFEASVRYHIWLGTAMMFFASLHGAGTYFVWGMKQRIQDEMWKWQSKGRIYLAGEIALLTGLTIWITSLPQIRRKWFEVFYYTHHLYIVFILFFLFHCGDRHFYMVFPGVFLFAIDKILRIIQSRPETRILSARVFPCKAVELTFQKDPKLKYAPTSVLFLKIPSISKFQWHPFSIISSSRVDEDTLSILIKSEGQWTSSLYDKICSETVERKCITVSIEGPYGEPDPMNFIRNKYLLLVAGGIGVTPFLSILQEIGSNLNRGGNRYPGSIQLIYIVKKSQDISLINPIVPQILNSQQFRIKLKVFVTRENQTGTTSLREVLNGIPDVQILNLGTISSTHAIYEPERFLWLAIITTVSSIQFLMLLGFFNYLFIKPAKNLSEQKSPSSLIDFLLICAFAVAITISALMVVMIRWKRLRKKLPLLSDIQCKDMKQRLLEANMDGHEIHFRGRPNFEDLFSDFARECEGSDIGVLVCGPEGMKESVASTCKLGSRRNAKEKKKTHFSFHSLNFTL